MNLIMVSYAGSHLYGLTTPKSDIDLRGVCFNSVNSLLGWEKFEQFQPNKKEALEYSQSKFNVKSDDLTIYGLNKFLKLCLDANPNIIELLFSNNLVYTSSVWDLILQYRDCFLSTKIIHTFSGYAYSQLKKIETHYKWLNYPPEKPNPEDYGMVKNNKGGQTSTNLKNEYHNRLKNYQSYKTWLKNRNPKRHKLELEYGYDTKHISHVIRLLLEAEEILETGHLELPLKYREYIFNIGNGSLAYEQVLYLAKLAKERLEKLPTDLPEEPNRNKIEELMMELNFRYVVETY